jgi:hypothetical protein
MDEDLEIAAEVQRYKVRVQTFQVISEILIRLLVIRRQKQDTFSISSNGAVMNGCRKVMRVSLLALHVEFDEAVRACRQNIYNHQPTTNCAF